MSECAHQSIDLSIYQSMCSSRVKLISDLAEANNSQLLKQTTKQTTKQPNNQTNKQTIPRATKERAPIKLRSNTPSTAKKEANLQMAGRVKAGPLASDQFVARGDDVLSLHMRYLSISTHDRCLFDACLMFV
mmetsp:Transcript_13606/g.23427  ORF Transcript_13606/g.23427 Transcript_13606/m.23427 type:complete len:132 (-) Transcript_13606:6-401(-)